MSKDTKHDIEDVTGINKTDKGISNNEFYAIEEVMPIFKEPCDDKYKCAVYAKLKRAEICPTPNCGKKKPPF